MQEKSITQIVNDMNLDLRSYKLRKIITIIECNNYLLLQSGNIYTLIKISAVKTSAMIDIAGTVVYGLPSMVGQVYNINVFGRFGLIYASYYSVDGQGKKQFWLTESVDNLHYGKEMLF